MCGWVVLVLHLYVSGRQYPSPQTIVLTVPLVAQGGILTIHRFETVGIAANLEPSSQITVNRLYFSPFGSSGTSIA